MKIETWIPHDGPGVSATWVLQRQPDMTATLDDIVEALRWAERDGRVTKLGAYYWRNRARL